MGNCVFKNINDRLPEEALEYLEGLEPSTQEHLKDWSFCEGRYKQMQKYLMVNRNVFFTDQTKSWCDIHHRMCPVFDPHDEETPAKDQPLRVNFAGSPCVAWSSVGTKAKGAHTSERDFSIWLAERAARADQRRENVFFQECTERFPHDQKLATPLDTTHHVVQAKVTPDDMVSNAGTQDRSQQVWPSTL